MALEKKTARRKKARKKATTKVTKKNKTKVAKKTGRAAAKKKQKKKSARKKAPSINIEVRDSEGRASVIVGGKALQERAMRWRFRLTKRVRWVRGPEESDHRQKLLDELSGLEGSADLLSWIAGAHFVEVGIPYTTEDEGWEARIAPWEFLLSASSKVLGRTDDFTVVRRLDRERGKLTRPKKVQRSLYVELAPGALRDHYSFETERQLVHRLLPGVLDLRNPTLEELRSTVAKLRPQVIHIAGLDNRQARVLLEPDRQLPESWPDEDGAVLSDGAGGLAPTCSADLARALSWRGAAPQLVFVNLFHSASRTCALAVAEGAGHAIGFQDTIDDELAEILISGFYSDCRHAGWKILPAFVESIRAMRRAPRKLKGTGIVLWSDRSLLDEEYALIAGHGKDRDRSRSKAIAIPKSSDYDWLDVQIEPNNRINYSLMHNDAGRLFSSFGLRKTREGTLRNVHVEVVLHVGSDSFPFRKTFDLTDTKFLETEVKIPLTSDLIRTIQEPLKTTLFVEVRHEDRVLRRETHRVTLLPADEWRDTDENRLWLPSFVLPRDDSVRRIIDTSQEHLMTLADDRARGFDGYQCADPEDPDSLDDLDIQAQAIWAAIVHHYQIKYINPPPSYTETGQRLRTPTQILRGRRGTCIDLALLFSACLEYVDIYPVVFLLEGHAFTGYWRHEDYHVEFKYASDEGIEDHSLKTSVGGDSADRAWVFPHREYSEILRQINHNRLYPIETVGLTTHGSFWQAVDEGLENLRDRDEFHSMIDVKNARDEFVTPLPIKETSLDDPA